MNKRDDQPESLMSLAKRWLKTQTRFHGDPHRAVHDRREADELESRMEEKVEQDVGRAVLNTVMPASWKQKLSEIERQSEERKAEAVRQRRAEHEARPRAELHARFAGDVLGAIQEPTPVVVYRPEATGDALTVELEPLDPIPVGGRYFLGLQFAVPAYAGPGAYDLSAMAAQNGAEEWDPLWFQLWLDTLDEPFYWVSEYGPATVTVEPGERTIRVRMAMEDAGSTKVNLDATIVLP